MLRISRILRIAPRRRTNSSWPGQEEIVLVLGAIRSIRPIRSMRPPQKGRKGQRAGPRKGGRPVRVVRRAPYSSSRIVPTGS